MELRDALAKAKDIVEGAIKDLVASNKDVTMKWRHLNHRPRGITIAVILQICIAIISLVWGAYAVALTIFGVLPLAIGVFFIFVSIGLYTGNGWAWTATIIATLVGIPLYFAINTGLLPSFDVEAFLEDITHNIPGLIAIMLILLLILLYMLRPTTRAYFGKAKLSA